jgi:NTP pyrophosphatase (non-canonical NTP hydrolase)
MSQFITDALRTKSDKNFLGDIAPWKIGLIVAAAFMAGDMADKLKKQAFYGKDGGLDKLDPAKVEAEVLSHNWKIHHLDPDLVHAILGIFTEAGELMEALGIAIHDGTDLDLVNLFEEVGDLQWYEALLLSKLGKTHEDSQASVIAKLKKRYPEKFTADAAINRDVVAEREVLEQDFSVHAQGEGQLLEQVFDK